MRVDKRTKIRKIMNKLHFWGRGSRFWESKGISINFKPRSSFWDGFREKKGKIYESRKLNQNVSKKIRNRKIDFRDVCEMKFRTDGTKMKEIH